MDCTSHYIISAVGMVFFAGFAISSLVVSPLGDIFGRKKIYVYLMFVNLFTYIVLMCLPAGNFNYVYVIIVTFFINGLMAGGKTAIGYVYMMELIP